MLLAGIVGQDGMEETANLINSILNTTGQKVSIIDSKSLLGFEQLKIKSYMNELEKNGVDVLILKINIPDAERINFNHLHFDIIIITEKTGESKEPILDNYKVIMRRVFSMLDDKGIIIVNVDDNELIQLLQGMKYYIVTYGFNKKASITASSIGDVVFKDNFLCCLQRTISTKNGLLVEPQEYVIKVESEKTDAYNLLAAATFAIVNGVDLNSL